LRAITFFCAVILAFLLTSCSAFHGTLDLTTDRPETCEIHHIAMMKQKVPLTYGMRFYNETDAARRSSFPHANEPHDTMSCCPLPQSSAWVFVCTECTKARTAWYAKNVITNK
jgi:hypothetical protein